ncbi:MAG: hypothetical protein E7582_01190 [Ruminococcaceae bacterium]|nr:hypothetical protein [Oscillospiraceae bacterium]
MENKTFISEVSNGGNPNPKDNIFAGIWKQYERVVLHSLITSFGLDFLVHDQVGGDVDTVHGVREGIAYKNPDNAAAYEARGYYDTAAYHGDDRYKMRVQEARAAFNSEGIRVEDAYVPGRLLSFTKASAVGTTGRANLDHVVAAKEIHEDRGRILAGIDGVDLANSEYNLRFTNENLNKSKGADSVEEVLNRKSHNFDGEKGRKIPDEVADKMREEDKQARAHMDKEIETTYYSSARFLEDAAVAACQRGVEMGMRQAVGFYFLEIWLACEEEFEGINAHCEIATVIAAIKNGVAKGSENALKKYKELFRNFGEGFVAGAMASLTTTLINIFVTTDRNTARYIRQASAAVVQAGNILIINPNNLLIGEQLKAATVTLATGASVIAGTAAGSLIEKTPIYKVPEVGKFVQIFCSTLVSGLLSCTLLIMLDRSKFINNLVAALNKYEDETRNYVKLAEEFSRMAAEMENYDIATFRADVMRFYDVTYRIAAATNEEEMERVLLSVCTIFDIDMPWGEDLDSFMGDSSNKLVFN